METRVTIKQDVIQKAKEEIEQKTGKTPEQLYEEREKRVMDAIALKEPDRVPVVLRGGYFSLRYVGLPFSTVFYDAAAYRQAAIKTVLDLEPDVYQGFNHSSESALALEALGAKHYRWPGGTLPPNVTNQYAVGEWMKADEYDIFMTDPTDFYMRYFLPRQFGALEPLSGLPTLGERLNQVSGSLPLTTIFTRPEFRKMANDVLKAGQEEAEFTRWNEQEEIGALGFPPFTYPGGCANPPIDIIPCHLRGMRGFFSDMFQRPEKLLAAAERILEWRLARTRPADLKAKWNPRRVGCGAFHFGSDRFMSKKQFGTFYWPTFKKALSATIDMGFIPSPHMEAKCDDRLEYFLEMPRGKLFIWFEEQDMAQAKAVLGNHCCISGNVPAILLEAGSPQEVEECCKDIIKVCGKGGGFVLGSASVLDEAKPANVKAMIDSVKKYGRY